MTLSDTARPLLFLGRLVSFAAAALAVALMVWQGYDLLRYAFSSEDPIWGEVGVFPFVVVLRVVVAVWVAWSVVRLGGRVLVRVLLAAFGVSFLLLYGWYFLLLGYDNGFFYWVVAGDFLYLTGGLMAGCAMRLAGAETRLENGRV